MAKTPIATTQAVIAILRSTGHRKASGKFAVDAKL